MRIWVLLCISVATAAGEPAAFERVRLPWGTAFSGDSLVFPDDWFNKAFPASSRQRDYGICTVAYPDGAVRELCSYRQGLLHGPRAEFHRNGQLRLLVKYHDAKRDGPLRVWAATKQDPIPPERQSRGRSRPLADVTSLQYLLYAEYTRDKKDGIVCLFREGWPWWIQEWKNGKLLKECLVEWTEGKATIAERSKVRMTQEGRQKLLDAVSTLITVEAEVTQAEKQLKQNLRAWYLASLRQLRQSRVSSIAASKARRRQEQAREKGQAINASTRAFFQNALQGAMRRSGL